MRLVFLIITYLLVVPVGNTADFSKYKSSCADIGFTPDTDPFADCVLKLYKRDKVNVKDQVNKETEMVVEREKQTNYEKERLEIEKERLKIEKDRDRREAEEKEALAKAIYNQNLRDTLDRIFTPPSRGRALNCSRHPNVDGTRDCYFE